MLTFLAGLACGGVSGGLTFMQTGDPQISLVLGVLATVLAWVLRGISLIVGGS